jgi:MFS transporter, OPA family, glycerol-3-phosphate transporter
LDPRYERWRWQTFGITWLIYASFYLTRQSFGVAKVALHNDPHVALYREDYGLIDSTFLATYMAGQFFFGPLGDRFGPRRIILGGLILSVVAAVASGFATVLWGFCLFAVLQGIAQSTGWTNTTKTMSSWFSVGERGRVIGWWCTHYTVGAAIALPFGGFMMDYYGLPPAPHQSASGVIPYWPAAFWGPAAVLAVVCLLAWLMLRNRPEDVGLPPIEQYHGELRSISHCHQPRTSAPERSWTLIAEVLASPSIWMLATAYFFIKLARYALYFWGAKYVAESIGSGAYESTFTAATMPIGGVLGVISIGYVSDKLFRARRAPATILSLLATAGVMSFGLTTINDVWMMRGFLFLIGFFLFGPDSMISATAAMDFGTRRGAGTATGLVNGVGSLGAILGGYLPGVLTNDDDWSTLFYVFVVGLLISSLILLPLWRKKPSTN